MTELVMSDRKKMEILEVLMDRKSHTYHALAEFLKTNYWTVRKNCSFLAMLGLVEVIRVGEGGAPGKRHQRIKITAKGAEFIGKHLRNQKSLYNTKTY